jgi:hypothetical protein
MSKANRLRSRVTPERACSDSILNTSLRSLHVGAAGQAREPQQRRWH